MHHKHGCSSHGALRTWSAEAGPLDSRALADVVETLRHGDIVLLPTESSYALAVDSRLEDAISRVRALKDRDVRKPLLLLAGSGEQVRDVALLDERSARLATAWPAPLTLVLPARDAALSQRLGAPAVAIRVPAHEVARQVSVALGAPVTGTSANLAGEPAVLDGAMACALVERAGAGAIAGFVDAGRLRGGEPSTLVEVTGDAVRILRQGAFPAERVRELAEGTVG